MLLSLATGLSNQGAFKNRWKLVLSEIERVKVLQKDAVQTLNLERERYNVFIEEIYNKFQFLVNILNEK